MPGWFKKAWYGLASLLSFSSFILIIVALAVPHWLSGKILCQTGVDLVNATDPELIKFIGDIYYGLFRGCKVRQCGLGGRQSQFTIFPHLVKELNAGLHVTILLLLFLALALALVSMGFAILNMIQVPYRAVNGPGGICLWNVLAGGVVALAIASFMASVKFHDLTERIANFQEKLFRFVVVEEQYEESFWICVASASAHAANLVVVAISQIPLPEIKTKIEEATVTAEDILY
ncbi:clarin-2 [Prionailurus viverrinus]|uniref:Clarin-2 n=2 Tax=Felinae TaxID=338152 RepID=A0A6J0A592_ACIJB|nr:clarin-2 [Acinonyx jubatus]XP_030167832.1 clarin-2 [Lynx canadensis]XP_043411032.1 clarin-2 [Prionailurus bengalensis]XP_045306740.1 clarin-2 [Leopardus geoffroyi]XP_046947025.1 clarin-2 [Lynx rufus]XP_047713194.1 clarin-2 [Prionailurus viverrinus]